MLNQSEFKGCACVGGLGTLDHLEHVQYDCLAGLVTTVARGAKRWRLKHRCLKLVPLPPVDLLELIAVSALKECGP